MSERSTNQAQQWREASLELHRLAEQFEQRARAVEVLTTISPEPTVEIDGVVMTQSQFDAARYPLLNGGAAPGTGDEMSIEFGREPGPSPAQSVPVDSEEKETPNAD